MDPFLTGNGREKERGTDRSFSRCLPRPKRSSWRLISVIVVISLLITQLLRYNFIVAESIAMVVNKNDENLPMFFFEASKNSIKEAAEQPPVLHSKTKRREEAPLGNDEVVSIESNAEETTSQSPIVQQQKATMSVHDQKIIDGPQGNVKNAVHDDASSAFENIDSDNGESMLAPPRNLHKHFPVRCAGTPDVNEQHPAITPLLALASNFQKSTKIHSIGQISDNGSLEDFATLLLSVQACSYAAFAGFLQLAEEYNITRWSPHGGSLMSTVCHGSMNPWDSGINLTVGSCDVFNWLWENGGNVTERFPDIPAKEYDDKGWKGRLVLKDEMILIKEPREPRSFYKLKPVAQAASPFHQSKYGLKGIDLMCFADYITSPEKDVMEESGFRDYGKKCAWCDKSDRLT